MQLPGIVSTECKQFDQQIRIKGLLLIVIMDVVPEFASPKATCSQVALVPIQGAAMLILGDPRFKKVFFLV